MNIQIEPAMIIMQSLLSLVGFFSVFILTSIWSTQKELAKQIQKVLTQLACQEQLLQIHGKQIEEKCTINECPLKGESVQKHVIIKGRM